MPFKTSDDVYVLSSVDTGEVRSEQAPSVYVVAKDAAQIEGEHPEADLRLLPYKGRFSYESYYKIVDARRSNAQRKLTVRIYSKTGGRIR